MAFIVEPKLEIPSVTRKPEEKTGKAEYKVSCKVVFDQAEVCLMRMCPDGYWFGLDCMMWGSDEGEPVAPDDRLFFVQSWRFPGWFGGNIQETFAAERSDTVPEGWFNEDPFPWPFGRDEIYARFTLENMVSRTVIAEANTNTVTGDFLG